MVDTRSARAGLLYCTVVFAAGFVLGVVRTLWVTPLAGEFVAILLEAPIMLAIAWHTCFWVAERLDVAHHFLDRLVMGGVALVVLICAEAATAVLAFGRSLPEFFGQHADSALLLGLIAQLAFALFPLLQRHSDG